MDPFLRHFCKISLNFFQNCADFCLFACEICEYVHSLRCFEGSSNVQKCFTLRKEAM